MTESLLRNLIYNIMRNVRISGSDFNSIYAYIDTSRVLKISTAGFLELEMRINGVLELVMS